MDADDVRIARRLVPEPSRSSWTGLCVKIVPAMARDVGGTIVRTPDHFLAAAWPPAMSGAPARWPEAVVIGSPTATHTLDQLFGHLPAEAKLYLAGLDDVDAELAGLILLAADRNLEPYQRAAIAVFAEAQRQRTQVVIAERYCETDPGFERFRAQVVGPDTPAAE